MNFATGLKLVETIGFPALIFFIWYLYHDSSQKNLLKIIEQQQQMQTNIFELLKDMIQTNIYQNGMLQKITDLITNNQWCPYLKEICKGGDNK